MCAWPSASRYHGAVWLRVYGLENEYAIVFETREGDAPSCKRVYDHLEAILRDRYAALPASGFQRGVFFANGARLYFEQSDLGGGAGFVELCTPECATPRELCVYHFALDEVLERALPDLRARIAADGYSGRLSLVKGNIDRDGRTYGSSESYLVEDPTPLALRPIQALGQVFFHVFWVLGVALWFVPLVAMLAVLVLHLGVGVALLPLAFVAAALAGERGFQRVMGSWERSTTSMTALVDPARGARWHHVYAMAVFAVITSAFGAFARLVYLRRFRALLAPFLVTRTVFAGNGHVDFAKGRRFFRLSSRADQTHHVLGTVLDPTRKPIFDIKHYLQEWRDAWRRRKRLVVLYSEGHACERALLLSVGATALVLEAIEAGAFEDAAEVRLRDPLVALHTIAGDTSLAETLELHNGETMTAIDHQRRYATIVRAYLETLPVVDLAKHQILAAWEATLDDLERDPDTLVGLIDWVTKRHLCAAVAGGEEGLADVADWSRVLALLSRAELADADFELDPDAFWRRLAERIHPSDRREIDAILTNEALDRTALPSMARLGFALRKIDLKYHDLDPVEGYAALLRAEGELVVVSSDSERLRAQAAPPPETRAHARGQLIARVVAAGHDGRASWDRVVDADTKERFDLPDPFSTEPRKRGR